METAAERDGQLSPGQQMLTPEQQIWGAQVHLAAAMTLWASRPPEEKQEALEEVLESYDDSQIWAYTVRVVEVLGFDVQPLLPGEPAKPDTKTYGFYL